MMIKIKLNSDDQVHFKEIYMNFQYECSTKKFHYVFFNHDKLKKQTACLNMLMKNMIFFHFDTLISDLDIIFLNMTSTFHKIFSSEYEENKDQVFMM